MAPPHISAHFQPIVDLARGVVAGYEALARFAGPPHQGPDRWFAQAHADGTGNALEARALATAFAALGDLPENCFMSVNLGPDALLSDEVAEVLGRAGDLRGVVLEITEQAPVSDYDALERTLAPLRAAGALLAIDDAGAGFASLKHVITLRPDFVKVDRALVAGVDTDETKAAVVETLGIFASRIDAWLVAEGVETERELDRLIALGVPLAQGYGLARPAPRMDPLRDELAEQLLRRRRPVPGAHDLALLAEQAPTVAAGASPGFVAEVFLVHPGADWLVAVDEFGRPVHVIGRSATAQRLPALTAGAADRPRDVARRAAARATPTRHAPVVVCDELGRFDGLVRIERLLQGLANELDEQADGDPSAHAGAQPH